MKNIIIVIKVIKIIAINNYYRYNYTSQNSKSIKFN